MPKHIIRFLIRYKYQVLFPITVIEGPIITIVSGFLVSRGYLSFASTLFVVLSGDLLSDSFLYGVGKFGRTIIQKIAFLKISEGRITKLAGQRAKNLTKASM